ncbi:MAG: hypothetical protein AT714_03245 [Vulcanisaeta sp. OSP_8]|jgi:hypothetical protein|nr:MAG: hypothetical protein AT714_03245 [Vulcanisaeta sp. OSP_8]
MLTIQRSIPIPRIGLNKLINYIVFVGENPGINCSAIRDRGLDIGKGRGDITRFFQRIGIVSVDNECNVKLTDIGNTLFKTLNNDLALAKTLMHLILYSELPHYRLLIDVISENGTVSVDELHEKINQRMRELSPTAWLNDVAYKALIGLAADLDVIEVVGNRVSIKYVASVSECIRRSIVILGGQRILRFDDLSNCLRQVFRNLDNTSLINGIGDCVEPIMAPNPVNARSAYLKVIDEDCVIRRIVNAVFKTPFGPG